MTVISLTSIPPRFAGLGPVLESLLAQGAKAVVLALPRAYTRFPGPVSTPPLPDGVELIWCDDIGPAAKLIPAQATFPGEAVAICDDDCLYGPGWLRALDVVADATTTATGQAFPVARLKRRGGHVAQGFSGMLLPAGFTCPPPPEACRYADDLWISAQLERAGIRIVESAAARQAVTPMAASDPLQEDGRAEIYARAAACIHETLGIWPPSEGA